MRIVEIGKKNGSEKYIIILSDDDIPDTDPFLYMCSYNMMSIAYKTMILDSHRHNVEYYIPFAKQQSIEMVSSYINKPFPIQLQNILHTKGKRNQEKLLKDFSFSPAEFISFLLFAGRNGYKFSQIFYERDVPNDLKDRIPTVIDATNDPVRTIGKTDLSVDALKHIVREKKRIIAQFMTNNEYWVCFYRTSKGLSGEEPGIQGSQPHMHFISSEYNIPKELLISGFKEGKTPSNGYHLKLSNYPNIE